MLDDWWSFIISDMLQKKQNRFSNFQCQGTYGQMFLKVFVIDKIIATVNWHSSAFKCKPCY